MLPKFKDWLLEQKFEHMNCYDDPNELYYCIPEAMKNLKLVKTDSEIKKIVSDKASKIKTLHPTFTMCITNTSFSKNYMTQQSFQPDEINMSNIKKFFNKKKPANSRDDYPVLTVCLKQKNFDDNYKVQNSILCYDGYKFFTPVI